MRTWYFPWRKRNVLQLDFPIRFLRGHAILCNVTAVMSTCEARDFLVNLRNHATHSVRAHTFLIRSTDWQTAVCYQHFVWYWISELDNWVQFCPINSNISREHNSLYILEIEIILVDFCLIQSNTTWLSDDMEVENLLQFCPINSNISREHNSYILEIEIILVDFCLIQSNTIVIEPGWVVIWRSRIYYNFVRLNLITYPGNIGDNVLWRLR